MRSKKRYCQNGDRGSRNIFSCHAFPVAFGKKKASSEKADPPFDWIAYVFSVHHDAAGIRARSHAHDPKEGAFSRSIGPHQPENALFLDCGDDVVQGVCVENFLFTPLISTGFLPYWVLGSKSYRASNNTLLELFDLWYS